MLSRIILALLWVGAGFLLPYKAQISVTTHLLLNAEITVCGEQMLLEVETFNAALSGIDSLHLLISMPPGLEFDSLGSNHDFGPPVNVGPMNTMEFKLPGLGANQSAWSRIWVRACCPVAELLSDGMILNPIQIHSELDFLQNGIPGQANDLSGSVNVRYADLAIVQTGTAGGSVHLGDIVWDTLRIRNGGLGRLDHFGLAIELEDERQFVSAFATTASHPLIPMNIIANANHDSVRLEITDPNGFQANEDMWVFVETQVIACGSNSSRYEVHWGCCGAVCDSGNVNAIAYLDVAIPPGNPVLKREIRALGAAGYGCSDDTTTIEMWYWNEGLTSAIDFAVEVGSEVWLGVWFSEFQLNGVGVPANLVDTIILNPAQIHIYNVRNYALAFDSLGYDPDGPGGLQDLDGDGYFDDLAPGDSIRLTFQMNFECFSTSFSDYNTWTCGHPWRSWYVMERHQYQNQCGDDLGTNSFTGKWRNFGEAAHTSAIAPTDFEEGDTLPMALRYSRTGTWHDAVGSLLQCPKGRVQLQMELPAGYSLIGDIEWRNQSFPAQQIGNQVTSNFNFGPDFPFQGAALHGGWTRFDLALDCNAAGPSNGADTLRWRLIFDCDTSCADCERCLAESEQYLFSHCGGPCTGIKTLSFDIERLNFGWTDYQQSSRANTQTAGIRDDKAYVCDTLEWVSKAVVGNGGPYSNFAVRFSYPSANDPYEFVDAWFYHNNDSCPILPGQVFKTNPGPGEILVEITSPPNCGPFLPGDSLEIRAVHRVKKFGSGDYQEPDPFRASYVAYDSLGQELVCDSYGEKFGMIQPYVDGFSQRRNISCDTLPVTFAFSGFSDGQLLYQYDFPAEFRKLFQLHDTIDLLIPEGLSVVGGSAFVEMEYYQAGGQVSFPVSDTLIPGGNTDTLRLTGLRVFGFDASLDAFIWSARNPSLRFEVVPEDCAGLALVDGTSIEGLFKVDLFTHANDPACLETQLFSPRFILTSQLPHLSVTPNSPIQDGLQRHSEWLLDVCNSPPTSLSGAPSTYTWLALEPSSPDIQMDSVELLNSNQTLVVHPYGNQNAILVELDSVLENECLQIKVTGTYGQCSTDSMAKIKVRQGWDCAAYPSDPNQAACEGPETEFFLRYRNANLQMLLASQDSLPIDVCDSLLYHLTLKSSGAAYMYAIKANLNLPPGVHLDLAHASYVYPAGGSHFPLGNPSLIGNQLRFHLDSLIFWDPVAQVDTGFIGSVDTLFNELELHLPLYFDCDFQPGTHIGINASGITACGDTIRIDPYVSPPLLPQGLPDSADNVIKMDIPDGLACGNPDQVLDIRILNQGSGTWPANSSLTVNLPPTFQWAGGFQGIHQAPNPSSFHWLNPGSFSWAIPSIAPGDSVWFQFETEANGWLCDGLTFTAELSQPLSVSCPDTTCNLTGTVSRGYWTDSLCCCRGLANCRHPDAAVSLLSLHCRGDSLDLSIEICNGGDTLLAAGMPMLVYADDPTQMNAPQQLRPSPFYTAQGLFPGECDTVNFRVFNQNESVYVVVNDDGQMAYPLDLAVEFSRNQLGECDFGNNLAFGTTFCLCDTLPHPVASHLSQHGAQIVLQDQSQGPGLTTVAVDFGDGTVQSGLPGSVFTHSYASAGNYLVCVAAASYPASNICCKDSLCETVVIDTCDLFQADAFIQQLWPFSNLTIEAVNTSFPASVSSIWNFGDGTTVLAGGFGSSVVHSYAQAGSYTVTLIAKGQLGSHCCIDTIRQRIKVVPKLIHPSPAQRQITLHFPKMDSEQVLLQISDARGATLLQRSVRPLGELELDVTDFPAGVYRVRLIGREATYGESFVKE